MYISCSQKVYRLGGYSPGWEVPTFSHLVNEGGCKALFLHPANENMYKIKFNFEQKGLEPVTLENVEAGQSLLEVALQNDIELHHNCGGVCACTTCHLYIEKGMESIDEITDREEDFIDRAVNPRLNSRLGCQSLLLEGDGEIEVTLPDQTQFLGE
jgi:ferredoxin, 2Fe-2S